MEWAINNGYSDTLTIDRIDGDGDYCPENCRFVTKKENSRHTTTAKLSMSKASEIRELYITGRYTQKDLGKMYDIHPSNINLVILNKAWV